MWKQSWDFLAFGRENNINSLEKVLKIFKWDQLEDGCEKKDEPVFAFPLVKSRFTCLDEPQGFLSGLEAQSDAKMFQ